MGETERLVVQRYQEATGCIDGCGQVAGQVGQDSESFRSNSVHARTASAVTNAVRASGSR